MIFIQLIYYLEVVRWYLRDLTGVVTDDATCTDLF